MKVIDNRLITKVSEEALISERKRQNYNFHETLDAVVQRMLNALEPGTYVQPHKHESPDKVEAFILLQGRALVVEFNDLGEILFYVELSASKGNLGVEIAPRSWHMIISLEPGTVVYEAKEGPYKPVNDKDFATWAPSENDEECASYINGVLKRCNISCPVFA